MIWNMQTWCQLVICSRYVWCGRLKSMQAKICFCWVGRKKQWIGWTEISSWHIMVEHGSKVAWGLWMYWLVCDCGNFEVYSGMNGKPVQTIEERTSISHPVWPTSPTRYITLYLIPRKLSTVFRTTGNLIMIEKSGARLEPGTYL